VKSNSEIKNVAKLFLKLGFTAFGGPTAHIAIMYNEVVTKRKWMTEQHFLDLIGATNLIPGPNSTEMAIHIGKERAGWKGLVVAGLCFILPAVFITGIFAWLYKKYGLLPEVQPFVYGIKPAIISVILAAIYPLAKKSLKSTEQILIGLVVLILALLNYNDIYLMFGAGIFALILNSTKSNRITKSFFPVTLLQISNTTLVSVSNLNLFLIFLKIGAILYGSGYVLFAFLDTELVSTGIISRQQLIDAIAVGQFTPGPVFSSVTFIGYQINGFNGALISTAGVFIPSFIFVALLNPFVKKMRSSLAFASFLDAVNVASIAIIIAICYIMGKEIINNWQTTLIAVLSLVIAFGMRKINSALIILIGSLLGFLLTLI